jgi:putative ABC transport system substrate-binding protein
MKLTRVAAAIAFFLGIAAPLAAGAQPAAGVYRIGYLASLSAAGGETQFDAFRQGLRDLGYVEGRTIVIETRWAEGNYERLPSLAMELIRLRPDLIVSAGGPPAARALKSATRTIPIVFVSGSVMAAGIVSNIARPGGNLTGFEVFAEELDVKRLELLKETLPNAARVVVLWNPGNVEERLQRQPLQAAAHTRGIRLRFVEARNPGDIEPAFNVMARERADAVLVSADPMFTSEYRRMVELATRARLPAMYPFRSFAEAGGLMSYGTELFVVYRNAAKYVDRILKGANPGDLPVEQPTKFEFVVNLKTAKALGLTIPQSLLLRADRIVE